MGWRAGGWHGPTRGGVRGQHDKVATPTSAMPPSAAQLGRIDDIGPPPVPYMKKKPSWAGGKASFLWEAIEERLFAQKP